MDGRRHSRDRPAREAQQRTGPGIHTRRAQFSETHDGIWFFTGDETSHRHRVAPDVHDAPSRQFVGMEPTLGVERRCEPEAHVHLSHLADRPVPDQFHGLRRLGMRSVHECFHEKASVERGGLHHRHDFGMVDAHRLFAEHALAGLERLDGPLGMHGMRRRDVDHVDGVILEQRIVAAVGCCARQSVFLGEGVRGGLSTAADGDQLRRIGRHHRIGQFVGDASRGKDSPACRHGPLPGKSPHDTARPTGERVRCPQRAGPPKHVGYYGRKWTRCRAIRC